MKYTESKTISRLRFFIIPGKSLSSSRVMVKIIKHGLIHLHCHRRETQMMCKVISLKNTRPTVDFVKEIQIQTLVSDVNPSKNREKNL